MYQDTQCGEVDEAYIAGEPMQQSTDHATLRPQVEIDYYTDPLCSWSWAFEPEWRRLRYTFGDQLTWRYHMGGMIDDWESFNDPMNAIFRR